MILRGVLCVSGLNELDVEGEWLVLRQVMWKVPQRLLDKTLLPHEEKSASKPKQSWTLDSSQQQRGEVSGGSVGCVSGV